MGGCGTKNEKYTIHSFDYFDTVTTITGYAKSRDQFDKIAGGALEEINAFSSFRNDIIE